MRTIAFVGGGTAGHVMPNLALISALEGRYKPVYIGGDGMEAELCRERDIPFIEIRTVKLRRDKFFKNLAIPFKLGGCVASARSALQDAKPDLIFSKGGYAALPVVLAAKRLHIPVICHESDFSPGIVTKLSVKRAARVLCAFEDCSNKIKGAECVGAPLRRSLYLGKSSPARYGFASGSKPILAVVGGSSGAATVNACVVAALPSLVKAFDVIHVTGRGKSVAPPSPSYTPIEFENDMPALYATADVLVTRAGAGALAEAVALKVPALCIPLEKASRGDQIQNANYYAARGAVSVLGESELSPESLTAAVLALFNAKAKYVRAMNELDVDGTTRICEIIDEVLANTAKA